MLITSQRPGRNSDEWHGSWKRSRGSTSMDVDQDSKDTLGMKVHEAGLQAAS